MNVRYVVQCKLHGTESTNWAGKQVVVSVPKTKRERNNGGCPYCKKEVRQALPPTNPASGLDVKE